MSASCFTYECVMSHSGCTVQSSGWYRNTYTYTHTNMNIYIWCLTHECVMSHIWMRHVSHMNASFSRRLYSTIEWLIQEHTKLVRLVTAALSTPNSSLPQLTPSPSSHHTSVDGEGGGRGTVEALVVVAHRYVCVCVCVCVCLCIGKSGL